MGGEARILVTDLRHSMDGREYPIVALIRREAGDSILTYPANGKFLTDGSEDPSDLINIPEKVTRWINLYHEPWGCHTSVFSTREAADRCAGPDRVACVEVNYDLPKE